MNFREGMRRIALLAGILGLLPTAVIAVYEIHGFEENLRNYKHFQMLKKSADVEKIRQQLNTEPRGNDLVVKLSEGPISQVQWTFENGSYRIESITDDKGESYYSATPPSTESFIEALFLPLLGFSLSWSVIRMFAWICNGFTATH